MMDTLKSFYTTDKKRGIFFALLFVLCLITAGLTVHDLRVKPLDFDGSIHLQVARSLAEKGEYASFGAIQDGTSQKFDPYVSAGPAVLFPVAGVFKLTGLHVINFRILMLCFYLATLVMMGVLAFSQTKSYLALLAPLLFLLLGYIDYGKPPFINLRVDLLGEIPAAFYILTSFWLYTRKRYFAAGVFAALSYLTKLIMFLIIPAVIVAALFELVILRRNNLKSWARWLAGFIIPAAAWEIYKFSSLGSSAAYFKNWRDYIHFVEWAGSGITKLNGAVPIHDKLVNFLHGLNIPLAIGVIIASLLIAQIILVRKHCIEFIKTYYFPLIFVTGYLTWWFFIGDDSYFRRVIPTVAVLMLLVTIMITKYSEGSRKAILPWLIVGLVIVSNIGQLSHRYNSSSKVPSLQQQEAFSRIVSDQGLPLSHSGWWQNPEVQFLTNRHSKLISLYGSRTTTLLVLPKYLYPIVPADQIKDLNDLERGCTQKVVDTSYYMACRHPGLVR